MGHRFTDVAEASKGEWLGFETCTTAEYGSDRDERRGLSNSVARMEALVMVDVTDWRVQQPGRLSVSVAQAQV
jgi:hypothetical protein